LISENMGDALHTSARILLLLLPSIALGLAGCSELGLRKGPPAVLDATAVQTAANNRIAITNALALDASDGGVFTDGTDHYYKIAEAGFNYVDDQCQAYFDSIFFIDRERSQFKSGLAAASATTAAILGVTGASTLSLSVVASAFGFASAATDIVAGTYLYSLPPATTQGLVNRLQTAYRGQASKFRAEINSPTAAYHQIQNYLALCLPPRIEAEVIRTVSAAGVTVMPGSSGASFSVESAGPVAGPAIGTFNIPASRAAFVAPIATPHARTLPSPVLGAKGLTPFEKDLDQVTMKEIQSALCSQPNGNLKSLRDDMLEFFQAGTPNDRIRADRIETNGLIRSDVDELEETLSGNKDCLLKLDGPKAVAHHFR
jgi:hypothetical protein